MPTIDLGDQPRQPEARARRDRPVRRARGDREGPGRAAAFQRIAAQRATPRRRLGVASCASSVRRSPRPTARVPASASSSRWPASSGPGPWRTSSRPSRATRRRVRGQGTSPEVAAIAADEREHAVIWERLSNGAAARPRPIAIAAAIARSAARGSEVANRERWHRTAVSPARCGPSSSGSATGSSATCRWSWASPAPPADAELRPAGRRSPACSPGRSAWPPASTSRCRASASCSSARSRSSAPRWRRCPRRRRPSWPPPTGPRASRREARADRASDLRRPGDGARHARPRGARPRSR